MRACDLFTKIQIYGGRASVSKIKRECFWILKIDFEIFQLLVFGTFLTNWSSAKREFLYLFKSTFRAKLCSFFRVQCSFVLGNLLHIFCTIFVAQIKMGFNKDNKKEQLDFTLPFVKPNLTWNEKLGAIIFNFIH